MYYKKVSFRDNLKQELAITDMLVKELASTARVHKRALDTYLLSENASMPPADVAVRIAKALGVSVEYLVTGEEDPHTSNDIKSLIRRFQKLNERDRRAVSVLINALLENNIIPLVKTG